MPAVAVSPSTMSPRAMQFVHQSHPDEDAMTKKRQKQIVRSNAARKAHAEARRARTMQYQARKAQAESQMEVKEIANKETPIELSRLLPSCRTDPFMSFVHPFKPIEHFLLDHYMTVVVPLMRCNDVEAYYVERMTRAWVPLALTDTGLLDSLFLTASRHLSQSYQKGQEQQQRFAKLAVQYKLDCLRSLRGDISAKVSFEDAIVAKTVMLAYDELAVGDIAISKHHVDGAVRMVTLNGGPGTLGLDGFLSRLLSNLLNKLEGGV